MASSDEIVDHIASFALFADLTTPQLQRIAHMFEEEVFPEGARVLRQGLSGSAFYIILDGEAAVVIDGQQRATLARGDFFGEVSILLGEPPGADIVASRPLRTLVLAASSYWLVGVAGGATLAFVFAQGIRGLWWGIALGIGCAAVVLLAEFIRATADDTQN